MEGPPANHVIRKTWSCDQRTSHVSYGKSEIMVLFSPPLVMMGKVLDGLIQTIGEWVVEKGLMFTDWNVVGKVDETLYFQGQ